MASGPPTDPSAVVSAVSKQHGLLRKAEAANGLFGVQLLLISFRIVFNSITNLYQLFIFTPLRDVTKMSLYGFMLLWELFTLALLTTTCQSIKRKAEQYNMALFKIILQQPELCSNENLKMYVIKKPGIKISACGFFSIGYPMVTSVFAASMTYLVILIQFTL